MKITQVVAALLIALFASGVFANEYVEDIDYRVCDTEVSPIGYFKSYDCRITGQKRSYSEVYTDTDGIRRVGTYPGQHSIHCNQNAVCEATSPGTYFQGEFIGTGHQGDYTVTWNFYVYLGDDGKVIAYRRGRGPLFDEAPVDLSVSMLDDEVPQLPGGFLWDEEE
jgi:hypothetical protein